MLLLVILLRVGLGVVDLTVTQVSNLRHMIEGINKLREKELFDAAIFAKTYGISKIKLDARPAGQYIA